MQLGLKTVIRKILKIIMGIWKMKEYTLEELANYNGKEGKIYVAFQGQIYDVSDSSLWEDGIHQGLHDAGRDLSEAMDDAPHGPEMFKDYPVVGTLKE
jgi:predicted heme/steroid binding protein